VKDKDISDHQEEINETFNSLFGNVDNLISAMKQKSSEEILNGSVVEAQKLLNQILPYQTFYEKLQEAKNVFNQIGSVSAEDIAQAKEKIESLNQEEIDKEVEKTNGDDEVTSQINYRIPILKALIFLGGSSEELEVTEFVKKEMKNKFTEKDMEVPEGEEKERWISNLYFETSTMVDEGLLSNEAPKNSWEIAQKGIDYLSKYAK
jgi:hypothetical protein